MRARTVGLILRKEILDMVRDRKALFFMILLPMLAMPLLMVGITRLGTTQAKKTRETRLLVQTSREERDRFLEVLRAQLHEEDWEHAFHLMGQEVSDLISEMAQDLEMTPGTLILGILEDSRVQDHPRFQELQERLGASVLKLPGKADEAADRESGSPSDGMPTDLTKTPMAKRLLRLSRLLPPLTTIDYVTAEQVAELEATKASVSEEHLPQELTRNSTFLAAAKDITSRKIHAYLQVPEDFGASAVDGSDSIQLEILYDSTIPLSKEAHRRLSNAVKSLSEELLQARLTHRGLPSDFSQPVRLESANVAPPKKQALQLLAGVLPYFIILMCFFGGFYPAIDVGAGEKERYTLESLLVTPALRSEVAFGKFGVIFLASLIASVCATGSLAYTFKSGLAPDEFRKVLDVNVDLATTLLCLVLIVPTAATFASVLLTLSIYAKSFKEAQAMISPVQFVVIVPAVISMIPDIELNYQLALVPILNIALGLREILGGGGTLPPMGQIVTIFVSTALLAVAAIYFCARRFDQEKVMFRS